VSAPRDADQAFERLLRQSLKTPAPEATRSCLDAETLAAWAEGGLSGHELELAQSHVADCARCQTVLAVLVHGSPNGLSVAAEKTRAEHASRRWLAWFVPLTAAAAAVAIWVAVPRGPAPEPRGPDVSATQMAQAKPPETSPPNALQQSADTKDLQAAAPAAKSDQPVRDRAQAELRKDSDRRELDRLKQESSADAGVADRADTLRAANEPSAIRAAPAAAPPAAPSPTARQALQERSANSAAQKVAPTGVVATFRAVSRWRISGTSLEQSSDGGTTWSPVATGVTSELTALASPSSAVCWVVGRAGIVLRTTDGQNFSGVAFPEITDLSSVQATDAQSATVTASDGRVFRTADGGASWRLTP